MEGVSCHRMGFLEGGGTTQPSTTTRGLHDQDWGGWVSVMGAARRATPRLCDTGTGEDAPGCSAAVGLPPNATVLTRRPPQAASMVCRQGETPAGG